MSYGTLRSIPCSSHLGGGGISMRTLVLARQRVLLLSAACCIGALFGCGDDDAEPFSADGGPSEDGGGGEAGRASAGRSSAGRAGSSGTAAAGKPASAGKPAPRDDDAGVTPPAAGSGAPSGPTLAQPSRG